MWWNIPYQVFVLSKLVAMETLVFLSQWYSRSWVCSVLMWPLMQHLTHLPHVPHICVIELGQQWFRWWLVACSAPSHYLNQCWLIVNWALRNKVQLNSNQNTKFLIHKNAFGNVLCERWPFCPGGDELMLNCVLNNWLNNARLPITGYWLLSNYYDIMVAIW